MYIYIILTQFIVLYTENMPISSGASMPPQFDGREFAKTGGPHISCVHQRSNKHTRACTANKHKHTAHTLHINTHAESDVACLYK